MDKESPRHHAPDASTTDPVIEAYKRDVDRTLLLENLKKTPHERVLALIALQKLAREARESGAMRRSFVPHCQGRVSYSTLRRWNTDSTSHW